MVAIRRGSGQQLREKAFWPNIGVTGMDCHSSVTLTRIAENVLFTSWPRKSSGGIERTEGRLNAKSWTATRKRAQIYGIDACV